MARDVQFERLYSYFEHVEQVFSPFRATSETSRINSGLLSPDDSSEEMRTILRLAEKTRLRLTATSTYIGTGSLQSGGLVKGWAVYQASEMLREVGIAGLLHRSGRRYTALGSLESGELWSVGIRNPFAGGEIVKCLRLSDMGIATSGTYVRGQHIYDPAQME